MNYIKNIRYAKKPLDRNIKLAMCAAAEKALNENANEEMKTMEVVIELNEDLIFNFKLVSPPHITNSHIESFHSGCTYTNENEDCPNDHVSYSYFASKFICKVNTYHRLFYTF